MDSLPPLSLPRSSTAPMTPPLTYADVNPNVSRNQTLIRRLSRGASSRLRGRPSLSNMRTRDQSLGSVRRRSESVTGSLPGDAAWDLSSEFDFSEDDDASNHFSETASPIIPEPPPVTWSRPPYSLSRPTRRPSTKTTTSLPLEGTAFVKYTKRKQKKTLKLFLDIESAKISWSATKSIYVDDIKDIRTGEKARPHMEDIAPQDNCLDRWLTIVYSDTDNSKGRSTKMMNLVADSTLIRDHWVSSLRHLIRTRDGRMARIAENREAPWLNHWRREMVKKNAGVHGEPEEETMDFTAIKKTCQAFSINKSEAILRKHFDEVDSESNGKINLARYQDLFRRLMDRRDIRGIFERAKSSEDSTISLDQFLVFLRSCQGVEVAASLEHWTRVFRDFVARRRGSTILTPTAPEPYASEEHLSIGMNLDAFRDFLLSDANAPIARAQRSGVELDRPLNEYYISSSHNTYLLGRQVGGQSSPSAYTDALEKGCRCVEIDCWDGDDGKPRVTHGRTLTTAVSFLECIKAIRRSAFVASDYPLIISLEVHCNPEQQRVMVEVMKEQFGDQLLLEPLMTNTHYLPCPESLKHKILVKVKEPKSNFTGNSLSGAPPSLHSSGSNLSTFNATTHRRQRSVSAPDPRIPHSGSARVPPLPIQAVSPTFGPSYRNGIGVGSFQDTRISGPLLGTISSVSTSSSDESDADLTYSPRSKPRRQKQSNIIPILGNMGVYTRGIKFSDWRAPETKAYNHIFSFNENTFLGKCKSPESKALLERHNLGYLMRVYPKGSRYQSSNFDPIQFWRRGVQMAATNWQTHDIGTQINNAMFAAGSDVTGYVLKPPELRRPLDVSANGELMKLQKKEVKFSVEIISAQWLTLPNKQRFDGNLNPYVEFEMYSAEDKGFGVASGEGGTDASDRAGMSGIGSPLRKRTSIVQGNGFDPVFQEEITMTLYTKYPSLVFVRWIVWNSPDGRNFGNNTKGDLIGTFTAKLSSLQQGYRRLRLVNAAGEELHSSLFCRIKKESQRDVDSRPVTAERSYPAHQNNYHHQSVKKSLDQARTSDDSFAGPGSTSSRSDKNFLRRLLSRSGSERRKTLKESGSDGSPSASTTTSRKPSFEKG